MYSVFLQGLINTTYCYGSNQIQVQRQLTMKNVKSSKIAAIISAPLLAAFQLLCCLCGLIFYVHYRDCDPMTSSMNPISSDDQLLSLYITTEMSQYPGLAGLCITGILSASLSSLSSAVNSMAAVTYEDIIKPVWPNLSGSASIPKIASVFYGAMSIFITYLVASMGNLVKASLLVIGIVAGPGLGVFLLAALTTRTTEMGANLGIISSFVFAGCMTFIPNRRYYPQLQVGKNCSKQGENWINSTFTSNFDESVNISSSLPVNAISTADIYLEDNFPVSFMWITPISLMVCVVVGYSGSWIISYCSGKAAKVPDNLLSPLRRRFLPEQLQNGRIVQNEMKK